MRQASLKGLNPLVAAYINNYPRTEPKQTNENYQNEEKEAETPEVLKDSLAAHQKLSERIQKLQKLFGKEIHRVTESRGGAQLSSKTVTAILETMAEEHRNQFEHYCSRLVEKNSLMTDIEEFMFKSGRLFSGMDKVLKELGISEYQWEQNFNLFHENINRFMSKMCLDTLTGKAFPLDTLDYKQQEYVKELFKEKLNQYCQEIGDRFQSIPDAGSF